ncbi:MAG: asparagine synthetase B [Pirellulaceae bacterium]|nr:MAG: asparagine synthetase B [Pirellulaceae bacterium]
MCGILGIVSARGVALQTPVEAMRDRMRHRGPDDAGLWVAPDRRAVLAHRRLAIIDLSPRGHQPMHDERRKLHIVFNGEIYNFRELREKLESAGFTFQSTSDTEVLLAAYAHWGERCVEELNGMYAFAIYDENEGKLFAARDRAGEKPFFYWHSQGRLWFASELKALFEHPDFPRRLDAAALEYYLAYGYVPSPMCLVGGVHKLPPASALQYFLDRDQLSVSRYWSLPSPDWSEDADEERLVDELDRLLENSVRRQLVADVPVGILLSGGVDSSLVAAMAVRCSSSRVRTFTISFPGHGHYDEAPYARRVAQHLGTDHTELAAEPGTVELLPVLAEQYDEPIADSSMLPTFMVARLIRRHATVALGGDGGDELFAGYPHHSYMLQASRWRRFLPKKLCAIGRSAVRRVVPPGVRGRNALLALLSDADRAAAQFNMYFDAGTRDALLEPLRKQVPAAECEEWKQQLAQPFTTPLAKVTAADFLSYLPEDILVKVDRASMLTSLEVRAPFLDKHVVEFAFGRVPDHLKADGQQRKILTRRLAARLLPADLDLTRKQGFSIPLDSWFQTTWGPFMCDVLAELPAELFSRAAVARLIRRQQRGWHNAHRLFALTILGLWLKQYRITW